MTDEELYKKLISPDAVKWIGEMPVSGPTNLVPEILVLLSRYIFSHTPR